MHHETTQHEFTLPWSSVCQPISGFLLVRSRTCALHLFDSFVLYMYIVVHTSSIAFGAAVYTRLWVRHSCCIVGWEYICKTIGNASNVRLRVTLRECQAKRRLRVDRCGLRLYILVRFWRYGLHGLLSHEGSYAPNHALWSHGESLTNLLGHLSL